MFCIKQILKTALIAAVIPATALLLIYDDAHAAGESYARAMGMGGSYIAVARNYHALRYNPANLGLQDNRGVSIELFSIGTQLKNNAFTYGDYNKYTGAYLTDADKRDILANIPAEGLTLQAIARGGATSFSIGRLAFSASGFAASTVSLPKDPVELILYGNAYKPNLDLGTTAGEAWGIADFALGYGFPVKTWEDGEISLGASFHYLKGLIYEEIQSAQGFAETSDTAITAGGDITIRSAMGGSGYSFDLGMATRFNSDYVFSFAIKNIINNINWNKETEMKYYYFRLEPLNSNSIDDDSITVSEDTTVTIPHFDQNIPASIKMGLSSTGRGVLWSIDYEQGFSNTAVSSTTPQISGGIEYKLLSWLPLRTGVSLGGVLGGYTAFGLGFNLGAYNFDFAFANQGSFLPSSSRGFQLSISSDLRF